MVLLVVVVVVSVVVVVVVVVVAVVVVVVILFPGAGLCFGLTASYQRVASACFCKRVLVLAMDMLAMFLCCFLQGIHPEDAFHAMSTET